MHGERDAVGAPTYVVRKVGESDRAKWGGWVQAEEERPRGD